MDGIIDYTRHKSRRKGQWGEEGDSQEGDRELGEGKRRSTDMKFVWKCRNEISVLYTLRRQMTQPPQAAKELDHYCDDVQGLEM